MKKLLLSIAIASISTFSFAQKGALTVGSYNLRYATDQDGENSWENRKDEVNALIRFHDFDIVGTQEGLIGQLRDVTRLEAYTFVGKGRDQGDEQGEHSAIFFKKERFKLLDQGNFWMSETPDKPGKGWDATCCNRISSWAKLRDKETKKTFFVFNTHFDHRGVIARAESGKLIVKKMQEIAGKHPIILTGDFNSLPETSQIQEIKTILKDSYDVSQQPVYGPVGTSNGFKFTAKLDKRIDYIFVSPQITVLKYGVLTDSKNQKYPSDHLPVLTKLIIK